MLHALRESSWIPTLRSVGPAEQAVILLLARKVAQSARKVLTVVLVVIRHHVIGALRARRASGAMKLVSSASHSAKTAHLVNMLHLRASRGTLSVRRAVLAATLTCPEPIKSIMRRHVYCATQGSFLRSGRRSVKTAAWESTAYPLE